MIPMNHCIRTTYNIHCACICSNVAYIDNIIQHNIPTVDM